MGRSMSYRVLRLCERLPGMLRTPDDYYGLDGDEQVRLLAFEAIREAEEWEIASLSLMRSV